LSSGEWRRSIGGDFRFFEEHHGNIVADRVNALADVALEAGAIGEKADGFFADDTDEDVEQLLSNRHKTVSGVKKKLYQRGASRAKRQHGL
jgi:hypothetical protein